MKKLYELLNDMDHVGYINIPKQSWLSHVLGMEENASARRVFVKKKVPCKIFGAMKKFYELLNDMGNVEYINIQQ